MPLLKRTRKAGKKRVLIIHHNEQLRRHLKQGLMKLGWDAFEAESRADGVPILFITHPDLVCLEMTEDAPNNEEALRSIRLFTDTPIIIFTAQAMNSMPLPSEQINVVALENISVTKIIQTAKTLLKSANVPAALTSNRSLAHLSNSAPYAPDRNALVLRRSDMTG